MFQRRLSMHNKGGLFNSVSTYAGIILPRPSHPANSLARYVSGNSLLNCKFQVLEVLLVPINVGIISNWYILASFVLFFSNSHSRHAFLDSGYPALFLSFNMKVFWLNLFTWDLQGRRQCFDDFSSPLRVS